MRNVSFSFAIFLIAGVILVSASLLLYGLQEDSVDLDMSSHHVRGTLPTQITYTITNDLAQGQLLRISVVETVSGDIANHDGVISYTSNNNYVDVGGQVTGTILIVPDGRARQYLVKVIDIQGNIQAQKRLQVIP